MAIDFTGHCRLSIAEAQRRIDYLKRTRPDWFGGVLHLTDAEDLGPFGAEIAREFGIEAQSKFSLHLLNKDWLAEMRDAVECVYQVFGTRDLVITWGTDSIRPPLREYEPMTI